MDGQYLLLLLLCIANQSLSRKCLRSRNAAIFPLELFDNSSLCQTVTSMQSACMRVAVFFVELQSSTLANSDVSDKLITSCQ